jgi:hypothetical protein
MIDERRVLGFWLTEFLSYPYFIAATPGVGCRCITDRSPRMRVPGPRADGLRFEPRFELILD